MQVISPNGPQQQAESFSSPSEETACSHRILVAISAQDRSQFFPDGIPMESLPLDWRIAKDSELAGPAWGNLLQDFKPTIIMTGWSTPCFDPGIINSAWFQPEYICNLTGSVRHVVPAELVERGILVTNWGTMVASAVAEHAVLLVLACARNLMQWRSVLELPAKKQVGNASRLGTRRLAGKRIGIHGCGNIAKETARRLRPFGVLISAYSEGVPSHVFKENEMSEASSLKSLFAQSDILIECESLTDQTRGMVTEEVLDCLPEGAIFVNVGRGAVVDESALAQLASSGRLRLGLDVYENEPLPRDSMLWQAQDALLSPHVAGPTSDLYEDCGRYAFDNIQRFLNSEPLEAVVDLEIYKFST
jgi:phosphoglycerate dehydrogenase-like enzyme